MNKIEFEIENVELVVSGDEDKLHIHKIYSKNKRNGNGTKVLKLLKNSLIKENKNRYIELIPCPLDNSISYKKLIKWYLNNGFFTINDIVFIWKY